MSGSLPIPWTLLSAAGLLAGRKRGFSSRSPAGPVDWQALHDPEGAERAAPVVVVCGLCRSAVRCECPRCDFCGKTGDPGCYVSAGRLNHGLEVPAAFLERQARSAGAVMLCGLCRSRRGCECPRCGVCGQAGNPACYASAGRANHGLERRTGAAGDARSPVLPSVDWQELHDPAGAPQERPPSVGRKEPSRLRKLFQPPAPGPNSSKFIGPRLPVTLEMVAQRARNDDMPLRAPRGGRLTAAEYPDVLERQWHDWRQVFGGGGTNLMYRPILIAALLAGTLVLAVAGYMFGPQDLGFQGEAVDGSVSMRQALAPYLGLLVGLALGVGASWWLLSRWSGGKGGGEAGSRWEQVYATARVTQVEHRDDSGRVVKEDAPDSRRYVVRRMNTHLLRAAFADRQEGVFVGGGKMSKEQRFRRGEIRLETARDLSKLRKPQELYDARPLTGRWRGVSSVRWFVGLRNPIETGIAARDWDLSADKSAWARRFIAATYGWWILLACVAGGIILLAIILDAKQGIDQEVREVVDRTPGAAQRAPRGMRGRAVRWPSAGQGVGPRPRMCPLGRESGNHGERRGGYGGRT